MRNIDIARALCIILVVFGHYFPSGAPIWYNNFRVWIYSFHMPVFMYLSGYVFTLSREARSEETYLAFMKRKAQRLLLPYFAISILVICIKLLIQATTSIPMKNPAEPASFLRILYRPEIIHLWFVIALWWIFAITALFKGRKSYMILLGISILLHYLPNIFDIALPEAFCLNYVARHYIYFMIGVVLADRNISLCNSSAWLPACIVVFWILNSTLKLIPVGLDYIGLAGTMATGALLMKIPEKKHDMLTILSNSSYTIYLLHSIFIGFAVTVLKIFPELLDTSSWMFGIGAAIIVGFSIAACIACHYLLAYCRKRKAEITA